MTSATRWNVQLSSDGMNFHRLKGLVWQAQNSSLIHAELAELLVQICDHQRLGSPPPWEDAHSSYQFLWWKHVKTQRSKWCEVIPLTFSDKGQRQQPACQDLDITGPHPWEKSHTRPHLHHRFLVAPWNAFQRDIFWKIACPVSVRIWNSSRRMNTHHMPGAPATRSLLVRFQTAWLSREFGRVLRKQGYHGEKEWEPAGNYNVRSQVAQFWGLVPGTSLARHSWPNCIPGNEFLFDNAVTRSTSCQVLKLCNPWHLETPTT